MLMRHSIGHWQKITKSSCGRAEKNPKTTCYHFRNILGYAQRRSMVTLTCLGCSAPRAIVTCWSPSIPSHQISMRAPALSFISGIMLYTRVWKGILSRQSCGFCICASGIIMVADNRALGIHIALAIALKETTAGP